jgi:choline dehydrogenase-like flavoprotein
MHLPTVKNSDGRYVIASFKLIVLRIARVGNGDSMRGEEFDYIVVGAGSAGCVVAARLAESGRYTVALIEAGGSDRNFWIQTPLGFGKLYNEPSVNWNYDSEPELGLGGKRSYQPRGKVLGGTGSINGMVYMRGSPEDYDRWLQLGNSGWGYEGILPYFKKSERNVRGDSRFHGDSGPISVVDGPTHKLGIAFMRSAQECGFALTSDHCAHIHEGFGIPQMSIEKGRRSSSATAYLQPYIRQGKLNLLLNALVTRILIKDGIAIGIELRRENNLSILRARREVVLCAGVFNTPQLLQLSGIGPSAVLRSAGIAVIKDVPGVGADLEDHFGVNLAFSCRQAITITDAVSHPLKRLVMGLHYVALRGGPMATHGTYCTGFFKSNSDAELADSHISMVGWARSSTGKNDNNFGLMNVPAYSLTASIVRPLSRGDVRIRSNDASNAPIIRFNFLAHEHDRNLLLKILRTARKLAFSPAMSAFTKEEILPGANALYDNDLMDFCKDYGRSTHHAAGSCKMGPTNPVDDKLCFRAIGRLRIVDASVIPSMIAGNINATVVAIAEKGAEMILEEDR